MNFKRIGRVAICLLLICCLTFHAMIPRAEASSIGAAATIVKASTVSCNPYIIAGATLIALGVYVGVDSGAFETVANNCVDALEAAGTWVKDGFVELLRTEDADGNASYYVDSGLMEDVRSWAISDGCVSSPFLSVSSYLSEAYTTAFADYCSRLGVNSAYCIISDNTTANDQIHFSLYLPVLESGRYTCYNADGQKSYFNSYVLNSGSSWVRTAGGTSPWPGNAGTYVFHTSSPYIASSEISLGVFPSVPVDGTSAREWSEEYTNNGLYIVGTGGGGNNNPNDGKWFWPLALTLTAAELYAMSQADQWAAETPAEFDQYETKEEFAVSPGTEVEFGQSIELSPSTDSETGGDTGSDTGTDSEIKTDYTTWFQKVVDWLEGIWEAITSIPDAIVNGIKTILQELFVPEPDFIPNKVAALQAQYSFLEPMQQTGEDLKLFFQNIGSQPPIIWIDLGAGTGWYPMGGKVKFIDLTWYSQYKPTADFIVGGSIWLWLAWRMFKAIPGIISGDSGSIGAPTVAPDIPFNTARLPVGRSRRKKDGE